MYLPRGITDDNSKLQEISCINHMILEKKGKVIYIAERADLLAYLRKKLG